MYTKEEKFAEATLYKALQNLWTIFSFQERLRDLRPGE